MDLGRNLIENEGNLREMGIEWIQITRRDYDVRHIYNEVEQIAQLAVKEDRKMHLLGRFGMQKPCCIIYQSPF